MKTRLITSAYILVALILAFASRFITLFAFDLLLVGFLSVFAVVEIARTLERMKKPSAIGFVGMMPGLVYLGIIFGLMFILEWWYYVSMVLVAVVALFVITAVFTLLTKKSSQKQMEKLKITETSVLSFSLQKAFNTAFLFVYPTLLFSTLFFLNHLHEFKFMTALYTNITDVNVEILSLFALVMVFVITVVTDSMAMITGRIFKGKKIFPIISPNKTYSGSIGGLLFGTASAFGVYGLFLLNPSFVKIFSLFGNAWLILLIGVLGSIACQAGDIFASYLKRKARVKDYGTIFPGHGGVMDRVDGLIATSTIVFAIIVLFLSF